MATRRNSGYSPKKSQRMTRRVEDSTVGSHVQRTASGRSSRHARPHEQSYAGRRVADRAARSEVPGLMPQTTTRERAGAYRTRVQQRRYMEELQRRSKRKRILIVIVVVIALLVAAGGVGCMVFMGTVGSAMALRDSDAAAALSAAPKGEPSYTLIATDLGAAAAPLDAEGPDVLLLACLDEENARMSIVCIPGNTRITMSDNTSHPISDLGQEGDAALINEVEKMAEVEISHYAKIDEQGLANMVDALGGITVDVTQEIDDPHAGAIYIPKGTHALSGDEALVFLRATNLKFGEKDRMANQLQFGAQIIANLLSTGGTLDFASKLDAVGQYFQTDYSSNDLMALSKVYGTIDPGSIVCASAPGYMDADLGVESSGSTMWVTSPSDMRELVQDLEKGQAPASSEGAIDTTGIRAGDFTIEVQNGTNLSGAAAGTADTLTAKGFNVVEVGNADQPIYNETLLAYHGENGRAYAQKVVDSLGIGRVVDSSEYYDFETDVLLILGADYKPA